MYIILLNFSRKYRKNIYNFLNEYRLEKAKWILLNNNISIVDLVEEVGFGSTKLFTEYLKKNWSFSIRI